MKCYVQAGYVGEDVESILYKLLTVSSQKTSFIFCFKDLCMGKAVTLHRYKCPVPFWLCFINLLLAWLVLDS